LATAEESGSLKLFKNPCTIHNALHHDHQGHSSPVSALAFSASDKFLVSAGSRDQGVLVWETDFGGERGQVLVDDDEEAAPEQDQDELEYFAFEVDLVDKSKEIKQ
jgi:WD40 repeat protein